MTNFWFKLRQTSTTDQQFVPIGLHQKISVQEVTATYYNCLCVCMCAHAINLQWSCMHACMCDCV